MPDDSDPPTSRDDTSHDDEPPRPRSVRDGLPPAGRSGRRSGGSKRAPEGPPRPGGPVPVRESLEGEDEARPTPVRQAMEVERDTRQPLEPPSVTFRTSDQEWIARVEGRTTTGLPQDAGAPLLFITFARAEEPERRVLEATTVARRLDEIPPGRLGALLDGARSRPDAWEPGDFFPETRKSRKSRR